MEITHVKHSSAMYFSEVLFVLNTNIWFSECCSNFGYLGKTTLVSVLLHSHVDIVLNVVRI